MENEEIDLEKCFNVIQNHKLKLSIYYDALNEWVCIIENRFTSKYSVYVSSESNSYELTIINCVKKYLDEL